MRSSASEAVAAFLLVSSLAIVFHSFTQEPKFIRNFVSLVTSESCPPGFMKLQRSCYRFSRFAGTWTDAKAYCDAMRAHLVSVNYNGLQRFLVNHLSRSQGILPFYHLLLHTFLSSVFDHLNWFLSNELTRKTELELKMLKFLQSERQNRFLKLISTTIALRKS